MAIQRSHAHLEIIIAGHRMVGFADEDQPYEFEWPELRDGIVGADGGHYSRAVPDFGGMITIRLSDMSPSVQWSIAQRTMHQNAVEQGGTIPILSGSISDSSFGISGTMEGMTVENIPAWPPAAGTTFELSFDMERFTPSVDGGAFQAPLTATAT